MSDPIENLRESYQKISASYQLKKSQAWGDLIQNLPLLTKRGPGILIDVGGGNGRNIQQTIRTMVVLVDLSMDLLRNHVCDTELTQRVAGALPFLPFRQKACDDAISIAVLHHFSNKNTRVQSFRELRRIATNEIALTVWRRWRRGHKEIILKRFRSGEPFMDLIDHFRPWKDSKGQIIAYRFYHYYTFRELLEETKSSGLKITHWIRMGGRKGDANFLIWVT